MRELLSNGHDFSLFEAVDLIDRLAAKTPHGRGPVRTRASGDGDATGTVQVHRADADPPPAREHIRFRAARNMGFPPADIARISLEEISGGTSGKRVLRYVIEATCLGLYGPDSPLPSYFNERIVARDRDSEALRDFLDLFNHRILTLLCRIGRRYRHIRVFDGDATDEISLLCGALVGESDPDTRPPDNEARWHRLRNATRLGRFSMSARTLEAIVSDRFGGIGVRVEEFVLRTVFLSDEQRGRLGERGNALGEDALLGDRIASRNSRIRLWLGPFVVGRLESFLPDRAERRSLDALLRRVLPAPMVCDLVLRVAPLAVSPWRLGHDQRLSRDAWLGELRREAHLQFRGAT